METNINSQNDQYNAIEYINEQLYMINNNLINNNNYIYYLVNNNLMDNNLMNNDENNNDIIGNNLVSNYDYFNILINDNIINNVPTILPRLEVIEKIDICYICFDNTTHVVNIPCKHPFHKECILEYRKIECPYCLASIY